VASVVADSPAADSAAAAVARSNSDFLAKSLTEQQP
jgi:hypothetical protein